MNKLYAVTSLVLAVLLLAACASSHTPDQQHNNAHDAQGELSHEVNK